MPDVKICLIKDDVKVDPNDVHARLQETVHWHVDSGSAEVTFPDDLVVKLEKAVATPGSPARGLVKAQLGNPLTYKVWVPARTSDQPGGSQKSTTAMLIVDVEFTGTPPRKIDD